MHVITIVRFDSTETQTCQRALDSITIAYPNYHDKGDKPEFPWLRAATATARRGSDLSWDVLDKAAVVFERQLEECHEQADVEYWRRTLLTGGEAQVPAGGTALIADPRAMCTVLAEQRQAQSVDAERALRLVRTALTKVSRPLTEED